jgi:hypothetical protein
MSKSTVTKLFVAGVIAAVAGAILVVIAAGLAFANDIFVMSGPDVVDVRESALAVSLLALAAVGGAVTAGGLIAGLVAWIGALLNTAQLENKAWFLVLLLLGIFNLGVFAMIAYVIGGPDARAVASTRVAAPA